jgi:uncharacterized protein YcfL
VSFTKSRRYKMKKRVLGTFLVAATLLTFNGCSSKQEINESNNTSNKEGKFLEASLITGVELKASVTRKVLLPCLNPIVPIR